MLVKVCVWGTVMPKTDIRTAHETNQLRKIHTVIESNSVATIGVLISDPAPGWDNISVLDGNGAVGSDEESRPFCGSACGNVVGARVDKIYEIKEAIASLERDLVRVVCNMHRISLRGRVGGREDLGCLCKIGPVSFEETNLATSGGNKKSIQGLYFTGKMRLVRLIDGEVDRD